MTSEESFLNNPMLMTITGYIAQFQERNLFSQERLHLLKHHFLITIGFLVLLYCLIHIQILFFWLLKFIFHVIFKFISMIFWLPLRTVRFLMPKSIDYDILFPLFWLCSISSFYLSKIFHENIWQFFNQHLVPRYKLFHYDQTKREDTKQWVFVITFTVLLLLQSVFILMPIALSIRNHHHQLDEEKVSSTPIVTTATTTVKSSTAQSAVKDVVETMSGNLYNRFVDAFKDENETAVNDKRSPLISDEKLEDTLKTLQKSIQKGIHQLNPTSDQEEDRKSSRFQRWIVHYLSAPFRKWEKKTDEQINQKIEQKKILENEPEEEEEENTELNSSSDTEEEEEDEDQSTITEKIKQRFETVQNKISSSVNEEEDDSDDEDESDDDEEESLTDQIKQQLKKPIEKAQNIAETVGNQLRNKLSSSTDQEDDSDDDEQEEEESIADKIKDKLAKPIERAQTIAEAVGNQLRNQLSSSNDQEDDKESGYETDEEDETESSELVEKIKETLAEPIEAVKNVASDIKNKVISSKEDEDDDEEESTTFTGQIKERLANSIRTAKEAINNAKNRFSSSLNTDEEELKIESDEDEDDDEEEQQQQESILDRVKENVLKPLETAATNLRDKLPSRSETDDDEEDDDDDSFIDRTKQAAENIITPIKDKISSNADQLKHQAENLVGSAEDAASNVLERSSKYLHEKTEQIKESLPSADQIKSKFQHQVLEPLEDKAAEMKKVLKTESEHLKTTVIKKMKSLKKKKKSKTLMEKAKDKFRSLSKSVQEKLPGHDKKKKKKSSKKHQLIKKIKSKFQFQQRLNGWIDEAWNIWHLSTTKLAHLFIPSTKHARLLPRYNTTSLYTAYTDIHCYDYTKKLNRYRLLKRNYIHFLDIYRHHSPFPVYLSVLKSNGPRCYRQYPNSSCGVMFKSSHRNFKVQLYRFVRFWAVVGVLVILLGVIYKNYTTRKQNDTSSFRPRDDHDRSSPKKQQTTTVSNQNDLLKSTTTTTTTQRPSSLNQQTIITNTSPLNEQIESQCRRWLEHEQNDGYRNLSETCRIAINNTFLKQLERLSVETLQFANAKISNVSQTNNTTATATPAEKIIINARLDIDHLILNIVNTFQEKHFSVETPKLSGQLLVILSINLNQYSIEAHLQQLQIYPINIIDPNDALSFDEKKSMNKLLDETIKRTVVRCSFRLSDNQENINPTTLYNSSITSHPDTTKTYSSSNQLSTSSIQTNLPQSRQATPNRYQPSEPLPTVLVSDMDQHLYTHHLPHQTEPKKLLVRIVKAVKLHDVEQPYCILEINHPKQIQQTSIAHNGLNPFWDERFLFECDEKSNQIHLQIIDRKTNKKRMGANYVDTVYADVTIPFSYVTSTVYKQDVQISPQHPESIIRIEFSTLSEEEALAANNGYDVESLSDSQTWTYNDREANKIEQEYPQRYPQSPSNDFLSSSYDNGAPPQHYGLSTSLYTDDRDYASTLPRSVGHHATPSPFSPSVPLSPRDSGNEKPHKSKSFMSSLKHLTLPRRKHRNKDKRDNSMSSQASSNSQLNTSLQSPQTNTVSHSLSSALPGPYPKEYILDNTTVSRPIRRSRSISQSFKNLFRSNSKKKSNAARTDALAEFGNVDNRNYLSTSTPTAKKLSFLHRRKSKQKTKQETNLSNNSLSSYDYSRTESARDTPIRANVGHPVTMTKSPVR